MGPHVDYQLLFNIALAIATAMGGWVVGRVTKSLDQLDRDVRAMPEKYVAKDDYHRDIDEMKAMLERIFNKLDGKADKGNGNGGI